MYPHHLFSALNPNNLPPFTGQHISPNPAHPTQDKGPPFRSFGGCHEDQLAWLLGFRHSWRLAEMSGLYLVPCQLTRKGRPERPSSLRDCQAPHSLVGGYPFLGLVCQARLVPLSTKHEKVKGFRKPTVMLKKGPPCALPPPCLCFSPCHNKQHERIGQGADGGPLSSSWSTKTILSPFK